MIVDADRIEPEGSTTPLLFEPMQVGFCTLRHRVVYAPCTRLRATKKEHVPVVHLVAEHYAQRASREGTLLITEATFISPEAGGFDNVPGIWDGAQIAAWKEIVGDVHARGSFIFLQLWSMGRAANPNVLDEESLPYVSASAIPLSARGKDARAPRPLTVSEIQEYVKMHARAARNAVELAGFDGVEIHGANGYLVDQFIKEVSNVREDEYGGSVEKRARFALEVIDAVVEAVGPERTAIRFSPWSIYQDMEVLDPIPQFSYLFERIKERHPDLAYIHLLEPYVDGRMKHTALARAERGEAAPPTNDALRKIWYPRPLITTGMNTRELGLKHAENGNELIGFGRWFISNPDLPTRLMIDAPLTPYDYASFYVPGEREDAHKGYIDYLPYSESKKLEDEGERTEVARM